MKTFTKVLTGARTRVILNGKYLLGATSLVLHIDARSIAKAKVKFFEYEDTDNGRRIKFKFRQGKLRPVYHSLFTYVTGIKEQGGKMVFRMEAMKKRGMSKEKEAEILSLIDRCTTPIKKVKKEEK